MMKLTRRLYLSAAILPAWVMAPWVFTVFLLFLFGTANAGSTFQVETLSDGSVMLDKTTPQPLQIQVTKQGTVFGEPGKDGFRLSLLAWGHEGKLQTAKSLHIRAESNAIFHEYVSALQNDHLSEKFTDDLDDGIRQEFIVATQPQGTGLLHLRLQVNGATANTRSGGATIVLGNGRYLAFDRLAATDSKGNKLPAQVMVAKDNTLDITVDDKQAIYPLTLRPALAELSVVNTTVPANTPVENPTATSLHDNEAHSPVTPPPEIIKAVSELRKPAPDDGKLIHHPDGSVEMKLGNRFSSVPVATVGPDGKVHVDYHGEAYVADPSPQASPPPAVSNTEPKKQANGGNTP